MAQIEKLENIFWFGYIFLFRSWIDTHNEDKFLLWKFNKQFVTLHVHQEYKDIRVEYRSKVLILFNLKYIELI